VRSSPPPIERIWFTVPEAAVEAYEAALDSVCDSVSFFRNEDDGNWLIEGITINNACAAELTATFALAAVLTGVTVEPRHETLGPQDWLARSYASFPEQLIGRRFAIRGGHIEGLRAPGRITLALDAGLAFGSGEHGSTRGCLRALERVARRRPRRVLDMGTGSGILAIAAARLLHWRVLATDIEPWSVRLARQNARANGVGRLVSVRLANGWHDPVVRAAGPYDLVLANILAQPLARMAKHFARHLTAGGTAVLSGLLARESRGVLAAYRRHGLTPEARIDEGPWTTLILRG
jgi:ribosomal protein L11 methyltransferase